MKRLLFLLLPLGIATAHAEPLLPEPSSQSARQVRVLWSVPGPIQIPLGETATEREVGIPAVRGAKEIFLRFRARFDWPRPAGMCAFFQIELNGELLGPQNAPILNRGPYEFETPGTASLPSFWLMRDRTPRLFIQYGPSWETSDPKLLTSIEEEHWYVLDVSSLIEPGRDNLLVLKNLATHEVWPKGRASEEGILVDNLSIVTPE